ncbi:MAG: hypothetical protein GY870_18655 [archaeon]|nr:hypothetical protein [archaeon]
MIKTDFDIRSLATDEVLKRVVGGHRSERIFRSERKIQDFEQVKKELLEKCNPAVVWKRFSIINMDFESGKVILEKNNIQIGGGSVVNVLKGSKELVLGVCTIGSAVGCEIKKYMNANQIFRGILLDSFGSWAVDAVRKNFHEWIKKEFHIKEGFRTSTMLCPGDYKWSVEDQKIVFDLLGEEASQIGVNLNESMMMAPIKSLSFIMGVGPNPLGRETDTHCDYCGQKDKCRYYHMRA